jgi:hypothetical protein
MSLRRADPRFLLPFPVAGARVLGGLKGWSEGLLDAGVRIAGEGLELVVAPGTLAVAAVSLGAAAVYFEGQVDARVLRRAGYSWTRLGRLRELVLPLDALAPARYALGSYLAPPSRVKRARNRALAELAGRGVLPPGIEAATLALREPAPPFLLAAARELGAPDRARWFLALGGTDPLSRAAFYLFAPGEALPGQVLKFCRVRGYSDSFLRDERGLRLAERAGPVIADHAPRLLGRFDVDGYEASLETAAPGEQLTSYLSSARRRPRKLAAIEQVCDWLLEIAGATSAPPDTLRPFRERLETETLPPWLAHGAPAGLIAGLPPVPSVFRRGDLGTWNVVTTEHGFTAVDWEDAHEHGPPLWDLFYFLTDALAYLDGAGFGRERDEHSLRLWRGELPSSRVLFAWTRRYVEALALPPEAVGTLATALWLWVASFHPRRENAELNAAERFATLWLREPALGVSWSRWQAR